MERTIPIDDQPIAATFFDEAHWLSDFVTPNQPDILTLWERITRGITNQNERIVAAWDWVANQVAYKPFIKASIQVEGVTSYQDDYWATPSQVTKIRVGNCANKAFLLTSLLRNELGPDQVYTVLGNLFNGHASGHAWVQVNTGNGEFVVEATRNDVPMLAVARADRYAPVHYFNDKTVLAVPGRTVMTPMAACYSEWLRDYLNFSYIQDQRELR
jgi:transglutaminase-like putative cysteine protease